MSESIKSLLALMEKNRQDLEKRGIIKPDEHKQREKVDTSHIPRVAKVKRQPSTKRDRSGRYKPTPQPIPDADTQQLIDKAKSNMDEMRELSVKLLKEGWTPTQISIALNCSRQLVAQWRKRFMPELWERDSLGMMND